MAVDRQLIIDHVSKLRPESSESGTIHSFGVYLNQLPADFWMQFGERIAGAVPADLRDSVYYLLYKAGNECGYHTGFGIITSPEWDAIVAPTLDGSPEEVLHAAFAVLAGFGWAKAEIVELDPGEKMVIRAYDYYESDFVHYGKSDGLLAPMLCGISSAFMDLAYGAVYPAGEGTFTCQQVKGIERGDDYGEFVVTKA